MALVREIRVRARKVIPPVLAASLLAYFTFHAVQGERGLFTWQRLKLDLAEAKVSEALLAGQREGLARRVRLLHPESLDPDLLEERAHALLGYGRDDELIILLPKDSRNPQ